MRGFEVIFVAPRSRRYKGRPVLDAVAEAARVEGIDRFTRRVDAEGVGTHGHTHSAHFFDLADEPEELAFILDEEHAAALIDRVESGGLPVFCIQRSIEYWRFGDH